MSKKVEYEYDAGIIKVKYLCVDESKVSFVCPFCKVKYNKNGDPRKNAKSVIHIHGVDSKTDEYGPKNYHCDILGSNYAKKILDIKDYKFLIVKTL